MLPGNNLDGDTETMFGFLQASSDRLENLLSGLRTHMRIVGRCEPYRHFDANAIVTEETEFRTRRTHWGKRYRFCIP